MSILYSQPLKPSKFRFKLGITLLIIGLAALAFGVYVVIINRENVLNCESDFKQNEDKLERLRATPDAARNSQELASLSLTLTYQSERLVRARGFFTQALLLLTGAVLVSAVGFCLVYLYRRKMRQFAQTESGLTGV